MSSARKRAAIHKANREADYLRQRLMLAEHHAGVMESFARVVAARSDELLEALKNSDHSPKCAVRDRDAFDDREPCSCGRDAALEKVGAQATAPEGHNAELSGPRPLAAEGSRSNDVLGNGGK